MTHAPMLNRPNRTWSTTHTTLFVRWICRPGFGTSNSGLGRRDLKFCALKFTRSLGSRGTWRAADSSSSGSRITQAVRFPLVNRDSMVSFCELCAFSHVLIAHSKLGEPNGSIGGYVKFFRCILPQATNALYPRPPSSLALREVTIFSPFKKFVHFHRELVVNNCISRLAASFSSTAHGRYLLKHREAWSLKCCLFFVVK